MGRSRGSTFVSGAVAVVTAVVLMTAAAGSTGSSALEPAKTIEPSPTTTAAAEVVVPVTPAPPTSPVTVAPAPTLLSGGPTAPGVPAPATPTPGFDALDLFSTVFTTLDEHPRDLYDVRTMVSPASPAQLFVLYLYFTALVLDTNTNESFPTVTATATTTTSADGLDVCTEGRPSCDVFSDFVLVDGLLASFSINGIPLGGRFGVVTTPRSYESLTFDAGLSFRLTSQPQLVALVLMSTEPGMSAAEIRWSDAVFTDENGTALALESSIAPTSVASGAGAAVLLRFADAPPGGTLTVPVSSDGFVTSSVATIVFFAV